MHTTSRLPLGILGVISVFFIAAFLTGTEASAQECDPNIPAYTQAECTETPQQPAATYAPPTDTAPYTLPSAGPSWNTAKNDDNETPPVEIDEVELVAYIQDTLKDIDTLSARVDAQKKTFAYFSVDMKKLKVTLYELRSHFKSIKQLLEEGDDEGVEQHLEDVDTFVSATFIEVLEFVQQSYNRVKGLPNTEIRNLLRHAFKPIATAITEGDSSGAHEALGLYLDDMKKNKKLYSLKRLNAKSRNSIQKNVTALEKKLTPVNIDEMQKMEIKKPSEIDTKRISNDAKKLNEAIQRNIQNDAQNRVWNLNQNFRY